MEMALHHEEVTAALGPRYTQNGASLKASTSQETVQKQVPFETSSERMQTEKEERVQLSSLLRRTWVLRTLGLFSGIVLAGLLLAYDFIFLYSDVVFHNTTSYFPWAMGVSYTDYAKVSSMFFGAEALSLATIGGCVVIFLYKKEQIKQSLRELLGK
jgi:hypothetical protein